MNFCSNCGHEIDNSKFCPNCGAKTKLITENKIDKSVHILKENLQTVKENVNSINNEIKESIVVNNFKKKTLPKFINQIVDVLGIIGLITIVGQIIVYFGMNKIFLYQEASLKYNNSTFENYFSGFIAEILPTTILPFVFMFLSGLRKKWLFITSIILLLAFIIINNEGNAKSRNYKENQAIIDTTVVETQTISDNQEYSKNNDDSSEIKEQNIEYINNFGEFDYKEIKYTYNLKCDGEVWGNCEIIIFKNNKIIFSENVSNTNGIIANCKFEDKYLYFESPVAGGSSGNHTTEYCVVDIDKLKLSKLTYDCSDFSFENCEFQNLETIKKDKEVFDFFKRTIIKPKPEEDFGIKYFENKQ